MWSPCRWVMKMRVSWLTLSSLRRNWCWVPSPQSNSQSSARWGKRRAMLETLRDRVGTPELVPRNVICKSQITSIKVKKYVTYIQSAANPTFRKCRSTGIGINRCSWAGLFHSQINHRFVGVVDGACLPAPTDNFPSFQALGQPRGDCPYKE